MLTRLDAESGSLYADLSRVELVGAPIWQAGHAQSRELLMFSGYRAYILNTPANCERLISYGLISVEATFEQLSEQAPPKERGKTRTPEPAKPVGIVTRPIARGKTKGAKS